MRLHANARLGPRGRAVMVERVTAGWSTKEAARSAGVSAQTCRKWGARYRAEGAGALQDRPSVARGGPPGDEVGPHHRGDLAGEVVDPPERPAAFRGPSCARSR